MSAFTEEWMSAHDGVNLYTRRYIPASATGGSGKWGASGAKAAILFVHGFIEHIARSSSAKYGKTSWAEQQSDIQTMLGVLREGVAHDMPIFLMGHSMVCTFLLPCHLAICHRYLACRDLFELKGGGLALSFPTRPPKAPFIPKSEVVLGLSGAGTTWSSTTCALNMIFFTGVIATSPLLRQSKPAPAWQVGAGGLVSKLPFGSSMNVPAEVKAEDLSHDPAVGAAYKADPFVKFIGTTKGVYDMLTGGKELADQDVTNWPPDLPQTTCQVCSYPTAEKFVKEAPAKDKKFIPFEGGYHELHNEPDGVQEKLSETVVGWILEHIETTATAKL
ncbi:hypothetical protein FRC12_021077 [Ceratobasidium sp. 428]|nr:hypothetical protein FRC12_021077 [Ceratobasidium sp. 428]